MIEIRWKKVHPLDNPNAVALPKGIHNNLEWYVLQFRPTNGKLVPMEEEGFYKIEDNDWQDVPLVTDDSDSVET